MEYSRLLAKITWSPPELYHYYRQIERQSKLPNLTTIPFRKVLHAKLLHSCFGIFIKEFNLRQKHDEDILLQKYGMLKFDLLHRNDRISDRINQQEEEGEIVDKNVEEKQTDKAKVSNKTEDEAQKEKQIAKTDIANEKEGGKGKTRGKPTINGKEESIPDYCLKKPEDFLPSCKNNFTDDVLDLLETIILQKGYVEMATLYVRLKILRIINSKITILDRTLKKFINLELLNLSCNWLKDVPGTLLPKRIRYLELYGNFMCNLNSLCEHFPKNLIYLGLGHNCLTNESNCHLLSRNSNGEHLRVVDISNNNIINLRSVLLALKPLKYLISLKLDGNPCALSAGYKDCVVELLPKLKYLDDTEFLESDYEISPEYNSSIHDNSGSLIFTCYRVIGLPPPPVEKFKKELAESWYYFEIEAPLIDSSYIKALQEEEMQELEERNEMDTEKEPVKTINELKTTTTVGEQKPNERLKTVYQKPDEYVKEIENPIKRSSIQSMRVKYSKQGLQFPEPTIVVDASEDLTSLRDTFRSQVIVRLIYLVTKKSASKMKNATVSEKTKQLSKVNTLENNKTITAKQHEELESEVITKKITIAEILCDLEQVNWSDQYIDFYWDEADLINGLTHAAVRVDGSLKLINYVNKLPKEKNMKTPKNIKNNLKNYSQDRFTTSNTKLTTDTQLKWPPVSEPVLWPKIFTIQLGFGLKRISHNVFTELE